LLKPRLLVMGSILQPSSTGPREHEWNCQSLRALGRFYKPNTGGRIVTFLHNRSLALLVAVAVVFSSLSATVAQTLSPVAVISVASIRETLNDVGYLTRVAGMADQGDTARFFVSAMVSGIDKERPIGFYFVPKAGEFHAVAFIPMESNGLKTFLKLQKD